MLKSARQVLEHWILDRKVAPGAQATIFADGRVFPICVGNLGDEANSQPVSEQTVYDLASLSKPVGTAAAAGILMQGHKLGLEDTLGLWLKPARGTPYEGVTIEQLLSHTAGFPDWNPLYETVPDECVGDRRAAGPMLKALLSLVPEAAPGMRERYSDLDFFLLGLVIEQAGKMNLETFVSKEVLKPLGMESASYRNPGSTPDPNIAPTENCHRRGQRIWGEVHDENAWTVGGAAGQAGLFGTSEDLTRFAMEIIDGLEGNGLIFEADLLDLFCTRPFPEIPGTFTLGWDTVSKVGTLTGSHFGELTIGHHGFTGTSLWIDPEVRVAMTLLTNRVYYEADKQGINELRPAFFDAAWKDLSS
jgi:serine-type D-Ala-D-Ala carboxypeptidase